MFRVNIIPTHPLSFTKRNPSKNPYQTLCHHCFPKNQSTFTIQAHIRTYHSQIQQDLRIETAHTRVLAFPEFMNNFLSACISPPCFTTLLPQFYNRLNSKGSFDHHQSIAQIICKHAIALSFNESSMRD